MQDATMSQSFPFFMAQFLDRIGMKIAKFYSETLQHRKKISLLDHRAKCKRAFTEHYGNTKRQDHVMDSDDARTRSNHSGVLSCPSKVDHFRF